MPSEAELTRRDCRDAELQEEPQLTTRREAEAETVTRPLSELQRYAGWLAKDHASVAVRADVRALGEAIGTGNGTSLLLLTLDHDIRRLPSGGIRKILRKSLEDIRAVLEPGGGNGRHGPEK